MNEVPGHLGVAGTQLWESVVNDYDLTAGEYRLLLDAADEADLIAALSAEWDRLGRPMTSLGSMKQEVVHPIVSELRQHRGTLRQLIKDLSLPHDDPAVSPDRPMTRSEVGKHAAQIRWGTR